MAISSILSLLFQSAAQAFLAPFFFFFFSSCLREVLLTSQSESSAYWTAFTRLWRDTPIPSQIQWRPDLKNCSSINSAAIKRNNDSKPRYPHNCDTTRCCLISNYARMPRDSAAKAFQKEANIAEVTLIRQDKTRYKILLRFLDFATFCHISLYLSSRSLDVFSVIYIKNINMKEK